MKRIFILYFIGILNVYFIAFPMEKDLIKWFQNKEKMAQASELEKTPTSYFIALGYYGDLVKQVIPLSTETPDPYKEARDIQKRAHKKIIDAAQKLESEGHYSSALDLYKYAPDVFKDDIARLEQREKKEKEEIAKAVKIAEEIIKYDGMAKIEKDPGLKLESYGRILKLQLSCPLKAPDSCRNAMEIQRKAKYAIQDEANKFKITKKYDKALATYQIAGNVFAEEINKLQKLINILPELEKLIDPKEKLADPKEYEQAYKKLDELEAQGIDEAKMLKIKIQRQEAEKLRKTPEKRVKPEQLVQEKLEQLKKTLIQLTEKLRSLANYITSQAPL